MEFTGDFSLASAAHTADISDHDVLSVINENSVFHSAGTSYKNKKPAGDDLIDRIARNHDTEISVVRSGCSNSPLYNPRTAQLIGKAASPVLLIPENLKLKKLERIAYITDLRYTDLAAVKWLTNFARPFNAEVILFNVPEYELPDMEKTWAEKFFASRIAGSIRYPNLVLMNIKSKDALKDVELASEVIHIQIFSFSKKKQDIAERFFSGTVDADYARGPLLIFP